MDLDNHDLILAKKNCVEAVSRFLDQELEIVYKYQYYHTVRMIHSIEDSIYGRLCIQQRVITNNTDYDFNLKKTLDLSECADQYSPQHILSKYTYIVASNNN